MEEEEATYDYEEIITIDLKIYMHCDACERLVRRTLKKIKGVDTFEVDRDEHKVTVTGNFRPEKMLRKIKKRTGKKAEILTPEEMEEEYAINYVPYGNPVPDQEEVVAHEFQDPLQKNFDYFNDENTNACRIM